MTDKYKELREIAQKRRIFCSNDIIRKWRDVSNPEAILSLLAERDELLAAVGIAQTIIDSVREDLHQRRVADWYPEGAHNAATSMSEDMRLIGNTLADIDLIAALNKGSDES